MSDWWVKLDEAYLDKNARTKQQTAIGAIQN